MSPNTDISKVMGNFEKPKVAFNFFKFVPCQFMHGVLPYVSGTQVNSPLSYKAFSHTTFLLTR